MQREKLLTKRRKNSSRQQNAGERENLHITSRGIRRIGKAIQLSHTGIDQPEISTDTLGRVNQNISTDTLGRVNQKSALTHWEE